MGSAAFRSHHLHAVRACLGSRLAAPARLCLPVLPQLHLPLRPHGRQRLPVPTARPDAVHSRLRSGGPAARRPLTSRALPELLLLESRSREPSERAVRESRWREPLERAAGRCRDFSCGCMYRNPVWSAAHRHRHCHGSGSAGQRRSAVRRHRHGQWFTCTCLGTPKGSAR